MQLRQNSQNKLESSSKQSHQTDNPNTSFSANFIKEEEDAPLRTDNYWSQDQERLFLQFWITRLTQDPLQMYSFHNPLKRSHYFKSLSDFLITHLGVRQGKDAKQCKSKFATIRRRIQREKAKGKKPGRYGFTDYIIDEATKMAEHFPTLSPLLRQLEQMRDTDSLFMVSTRRILELQRREAVQLKNNSICAYLVGLGHTVSPIK